MQLKFEHLVYQKDAISAIVNVFQGEPNHVHEWQSALTLGFSPIIGNQLTLSHEAIGKNLNEVQKRFGLPETQLGQYGLNFTVEMETGTG
ncbi:MAG: hypothetical protein Q4B71_02740, partial [Cardiobacteriaceae bacterium]|nr:hypothetical protein [Cardiobacteriaceae bacterium]